jgi:hypothetical protein
MKKIIYTCDLCEKPSEISQNLSIQPMDLCDNCKKKILEGNSIYAVGAMGHNQYYFKRPF